MSPTTNPPQWRRIYRQTLTLTHKNFLVFSKTPISILLRALIFPIALTVVFCELVHLGGTSFYNTPDGSIAANSTPIKDLGDAIRATSSQRLVFVRNGFSDASTDPIINGVLAEPSMKGLSTQTTNDPNDLFTLCKQSIQGSSSCFAAIIFQAINDTNVEYTIALDDSVANSDQDSFATSLTSNRILPIQWAIDSQIGNISRSSKPSEQAWDGYFTDDEETEQSSPAPTTGAVWLSLVGSFVAPIFFLILIGVVYHLSVFVATERQTTMAQLMQAQMVTDTPRILSNMLSFFVLYFPGILACSILMTQLLFTRTSDILFLFLNVLAGGSLTVTAHFLASFFGKGQLAGLYTSTLAFALALITLTSSLSASSPYNAAVGEAVGANTLQGQNIALSLLFPPYTYATLIADVAGREFELLAFSLAPVPPATPADRSNGIVKAQTLDGYLYVVFFVVQIILYGLATYGVERGLWGVKRKFDRIDASSDTAFRCKNLSKTYLGKRPWYWPFKHSGSPVLAVDDLDLEVKRGSVTFLLGPNGGGKTTALKCVAGMTTMDAGSSLEINENGVVFGICPQQNIFWENLTVQEHIKIWRKLKTAAFEDPTIDDEDVLSECDLLPKLGARAKTLSGGQKRKLQLAISFVGGSKVCCIDEASSGLDPLSRRNIWNIIQSGHSRRTVLVTTHFLDEADVLADHIAIIYKGKMVCEGPAPSLKARFGGDYTIRSETGTEGDNMVWRTTNSAEATRKILELENLDNDASYSLNFPTLEEVFLKVTSHSRAAIHQRVGDGMIGDADEEEDTTIDEKIFALENNEAKDLELDVGHSIGIARQVWTLFRKRYTLLLQKTGWISYAINLIIPIIVAAVIYKFARKFDSLQTCADNAMILRDSAASQAGQMSSAGVPYVGPVTSYFETSLYDSPYSPAAVLGPASQFSSPVQDALYESNIGALVYRYNSDYRGSSHYNSTDPASLDTRILVNDTQDIVAAITNGTRFFEGFGIFAPTPESAVLFHNSDDPAQNSAAFSYIMNRLSNATAQTGTAKMTSATIGVFAHIEDKVSFTSLPIAALIVLAFIAASSIAIIYPTFERMNRVRALHYSNGVSPFALWTGYLLFDLQIILLQSLIAWGVLFESLPKLYYEPSYILGAFILFGMATYLGCYVLSLFVKKAAFAIAAGIHVVLAAIYFASYVGVQSSSGSNQQDMYSALQYGLGLTSPAANLARALFVSMDVFEVLCGEYGDLETSAFSYVRYGSVYTNLIIQIVFLIAVLAVYEYGSADWIRRNITHRGVPARLRYIIDNAESSGPGETEKNTSSRQDSSKILQVSRVSKFFGRTFAAENISFDISSNERLALLGGNGAGKTTMINCIRGELKPDYGSIHIDDISVQQHPHKARLHMGVCPQDDAVDNLTVRQTLNFYASVKGLKNIRGNVDKVLGALNITSYSHLVVKALSGGTKRKLSVAIALLGNPRVLLLDEPSTGQDAGAKRILWKALRDISANRAILLTTHSMEEAEALATGVAIMGTRMLATGSLGSLQQRYGGSYTVRAVRDQAVATAGDVEERIRKCFGEKVGGYEDSHGQISFCLPHDTKALGSILRTMEGLKGEELEDASVAGPVGQHSQQREKVLLDYTVNGPTLEEVFMNVARDGGVAGGV